MAKCKDCRHKHICKHAEKYSQYQKEIKDLKEKWLDFDEEIFKDTINCTYYEEDKKNSELDFHKELEKIIKRSGVKEKNPYIRPTIWY